MAGPESIAQHDQLITDSINTVSTDIERATEVVENRLAELILSQPDNTALIQNRALLLSAFSEIDNIADALPSTLAQLAQDTIEMQNIGDRDSEDVGAQNTLSSIAQNELSTEITNQKNTIVDGLILGAVGGVAINELAQQARYSVSGLQARSSTPGVAPLQARLRSLENATPRDPTAIASVVSQLRELMGGVTKGANLRELGKRTIQGSVLKFDSAFGIGRARRKNIRRFEYAGGVIETTRPFCEDLAGAVLTEEEITDIWSSESWAGKEPGDPFVVRGGYNCRHFWVPVSEEE